MDCTHPKSLNLYPQLEISECSCGWIDCCWVIGLQSEDFCSICHLGGDLLCCDNCTAVYHLGCLSPPLKVVPRGKWSCPRCVRRLLLSPFSALLSFHQHWPESCALFFFLFPSCPMVRETLSIEEVKELCAKKWEKEVVTLLFSIGCCLFVYVFEVGPTRWCGENLRYAIEASATASSWKRTCWKWSTAHHLWKPC